MSTETFTIKQVAEMYNVGDRTVRNWLASHKETTGHVLGEIVKSARRFSMDEVELLGTYGSKTIETPVEVDSEIVEPSQLTTYDPEVAQGRGIIQFNIQSLTLNLKNADTFELELEGDRFQQITAGAFNGISKLLANDLAATVKNAAAQNRHAVLGAQAKAATDALKDLNQG